MSIKVDYKKIYDNISRSVLNSGSQKDFLDSIKELVPNIEDMKTLVSTLEKYDSEKDANGKQLEELIYGKNGLMDVLDRESKKLLDKVDDFEKSSADLDSRIEDMSKNLSGLKASSAEAKKIVNELSKSKKSQSDVSSQIESTKKMMQNIDSLATSFKNASSGSSKSKKTNYDGKSTAELNKAMEKLQNTVKKYSEKGYTDKINKLMAKNDIKGFNKLISDVEKIIGKDDLNKMKLSYVKNDDKADLSKFSFHLAKLLKKYDSVQGAVSGSGIGSLNYDAMIREIKTIEKAIGNTPKKPATKAKEPELSMEDLFKAAMAYEPKPEKAVETRKQQIKEVEKVVTKVVEDVKKSAKKEAPKKEESLSFDDLMKAAMAFEPSEKKEEKEEVKTVKKLNDKMKKMKGDLLGTVKKEEPKVEKTIDVSSAKFMVKKGTSTKNTTVNKNILFETQKELNDWLVEHTGLKTGIKAKSNSGLYEKIDNIETLVNNMKQQESEYVLNREINSSNLGNLYTSVVESATNFNKSAEKTKDADKKVVKEAAEKIKKITEGQNKVDIPVSDNSKTKISTKDIAKKDKEVVKIPKNVKIATNGKGADITISRDAYFKNQEEAFKNIDKILASNPGFSRTSDIEKFIAKVDGVTAAEMNAIMRQVSITEKDSFDFNRYAKMSQEKIVDVQSAVNPSKEFQNYSREYRKIRDAKIKGFDELKKSNAPNDVKRDYLNKFNNDVANLRSEFKKKTGMSTLDYQLDKMIASDKEGNGINVPHFEKMKKYSEKYPRLVEQGMANVGSEFGFQPRDISIAIDQLEGSMDTVNGKQMLKGFHATTPSSAKSIAKSGLYGDMKINGGQSFGPAFGLNTKDIQRFAMPHINRKGLSSSDIVNIPLMIGEEDFKNLQIDVDAESSDYKNHPIFNIGRNAFNPLATENMYFSMDENGRFNKKDMTHENAKKAMTKSSNKAMLDRITGGSANGKNLMQMVQYSKMTKGQANEDAEIAKYWEAHAKKNAQKQSIVAQQNASIMAFRKDFGNKGGNVSSSDMEKAQRKLNKRTAGVSAKHNAAKEWQEAFGTNEEIALAEQGLVKGYGSNPISMDRVAEIKAELAAKELAKKGLIQGYGSPVSVDRVAEIKASLEKRDAIKSHSKGLYGKDSNITAVEKAIRRAKDKVSKVKPTPENTYNQKLGLRSGHTYKGKRRAETMHYAFENGGTGLRSNLKLKDGYIAKDHAKEKLTAEMNAAREAEYEALMSQQAQYDAEVQAEQNLNKQKYLEYTKLQSAKKARPQLKAVVHGNDIYGAENNKVTSQNAQAVMNEVNNYRGYKTVEPIKRNQSRLDEMGTMEYGIPAIDALRSKTKIGADGKEIALTSNEIAQNEKALLEISSMAGKAYYADTVEEYGNQKRQMHGFMSNEDKNGVAKKDGRGYVSYKNAGQVRDQVYEMEKHKFNMEGLPDDIYNSIKQAYESEKSNGYNGSLLKYSYDNKDKYAKELEAVRDSQLGRAGAIASNRVNSFMNGANYVIPAGTKGLKSSSHQFFNTEAEMDEYIKSKSTRKNLKSSDPAVVSSELDKIKATFNSSFTDFIKEVLGVSNVNELSSEMISTMSKNMKGLDSSGKLVETKIEEVASQAISQMSSDGGNGGGSGPIPKITQSTGGNDGNVNSRIMDVKNLAEMINGAKTLETIEASLVEMYRIQNEIQKDIQKSQAELNKLAIKELHEKEKYMKIIQAADMSTEKGVSEAKAAHSEIQNITKKYAARKAIIEDTVDQLKQENELTKSIRTHIEHTAGMRASSSKSGKTSSASGSMSGIDMDFMDSNGNYVMGSTSTSKQGGKLRDYVNDTMKIMGRLRTGFSQLGMVSGYIEKLRETEEAVFSLGIVSQKSIPGIQDLRRELIVMSTDSRFSVKELANAAEGIVRTGRKFEEAMMIMESGKMLAGASFESLGNATDTINKAMTAFSLNASSASHAANTFHNIVLSTPLDLKTLDDSLRQTASAFGSIVQFSTKSGEELETYKKQVLDTTAVLTGMQATLGRTGSQSGTTLKQFATKLIAPTPEALRQFNTELRQKGVNFSGTQLSTMVKEDLDKGLDKLAQLYQSGAVSYDVLSKLVGTRHVSQISSMLDMINASGGMDKAKDNYLGLTTLAEDAAKAQQSWTNQWKEFQNTMEAVKTGVYAFMDGPGAGLLGLITQFAKVFTEIDLTASHSALTGFITTLASFGAIKKGMDISNFIKGVDISPESLTMLGKVREELAKISETTGLKGGLGFGADLASAVESAGELGGSLSTISKIKLAWSSGDGFVGGFKNILGLLNPLTLKLLAVSAAIGVLAGAYTYFKRKNQEFADEVLKSEKALLRYEIASNEIGAKSKMDATIVNQIGLWSTYKSAIDETRYAIEDTMAKLADIKPIKPLNFETIGTDALVNMIGKNKDVLLPFRDKFKSEIAQFERDNTITLTAEFKDLDKLKKDNMYGGKYDRFVLHKFMQNDGLLTDTNRISSINDEARRIALLANIEKAQKSIDIGESIRDGGVQQRSALEIANMAITRGGVMATAGGAAGTIFGGIGAIPAAIIGGVSGAAQAIGEGIYQNMKLSGDSEVIEYGDRITSENSKQAGTAIVDNATIRLNEYVSELAELMGTDDTQGLAKAIKNNESTFNNFSLEFDKDGEKLSKITEVFAKMREEENLVIRESIESINAFTSALNANIEYVKENTSKMAADYRSNFTKEGMTELYKNDSQYRRYVDENAERGRKYGYEFENPIDYVKPENMEIIGKSEAYETQIMQFINGLTSVTGKKYEDYLRDGGTNALNVLQMIFEEMGLSGEEAIDKFNKMTIEADKEGKAFATNKLNDVLFGNMDSKEIAKLMYDAGYKGMSEKEISSGRSAIAELRKRGMGTEDILAYMQGEQVTKNGNDILQRYLAEDKDGTLDKYKAANSTYASLVKNKNVVDAIKNNSMVSGNELMKLLVENGVANDIAKLIAFPQNIEATNKLNALNKLKNDATLGTQKSDNLYQDRELNERIKLARDEQALLLSSDTDSKLSKQLLKIQKDNVDIKNKKDKLAYQIALQEKINLEHYEDKDAVERLKELRRQEAALQLEQLDKMNEEVNAYIEYRSNLINNARKTIDTLKQSNEAILSSSKAAFGDMMGTYMTVSGIMSKYSDAENSKNLTMTDYNSQMAVANSINDEEQRISRINSINAEFYEKINNHEIELFNLRTQLLEQERNLVKSSLESSIGLAYGQMTGEKLSINTDKAQKDLADAITSLVYGDEAGKSPDLIVMEDQLAALQSLDEKTSVLINATNDFAKGMTGVKEEMLKPTELHAETKTAYKDVEEIKKNTAKESTDASTSTTKTDGSVYGMTIGSESGGNVGAVGWDTGGKASFGRLQMSTEKGVFKNFLKNNPLIAEELERRATEIGKNNLGMSRNIKDKNSVYSQAWKEMSNSAMWREQIVSGENKVAEGYLNPFFKNAKLNSATGNTAAALQEMFFSTSIQHGQGGASKIFNKVLSQSKNTDFNNMTSNEFQEFVNAIYAERSTYLGKLTAQERANIQKGRYTREPKQIMETFSGKEGVAQPISNVPEVMYEESKEAIKDGVVDASKIISNSPDSQKNAELVRYGILSQNDNNAKMTNQLVSMLQIVSSVSTLLQGLKNAKFEKELNDLNKAYEEQKVLDQREFELSDTIAEKNSKKMDMINKELVHNNTVNEMTAENAIQNEIIAMSSMMMEKTTKMIEYLASISNNTGAAVGAAPEQNTMLGFLGTILTGGSSGVSSGSGVDDFISGNFNSAIKSASVDGTGAITTFDASGKKVSGSALGLAGGSSSRNAIASNKSGTKSKAKKNGSGSSKTSASSVMKQMAFDAVKASGISGASRVADVQIDNNGNVKYFDKGGNEIKLGSKLSTTNGVKTVLTEKGISPAQYLGTARYGTDVSSMALNAIQGMEGASSVRRAEYNESTGRMSYYDANDNEVNMGSDVSTMEGVVSTLSNKKDNLALSDFAPMLESLGSMGLAALSGDMSSLFDNLGNLGSIFSNGTLINKISQSSNAPKWLAKMATSGDNGLGLAGGSLLETIGGGLSAASGGFQLGAGLASGDMGAIAKGLISTAGGAFALGGGLGAVAGASGIGGTLSAAGGAIMAGALPALAIAAPLAVVGGLYANNKKREAKYDAAKKQAEEARKARDEYNFENEKILKQQQNQLAENMAGQNRSVGQQEAMKRTMMNAPLRSSASATFKDQKRSKRGGSLGTGRKRTTWSEQVVDATVSIKDFGMERIRDTGDMYVVMDNIKEEIANLDNQMASRGKDDGSWDDRKQYAEWEARKLASENLLEQVRALQLTSVRSAEAFGQNFFGFELKGLNEDGVLAADGETIASYDVGAWESRESLLTSFITDFMNAGKTVGKTVASLFVEGATGAFVKNNSALNKILNNLEDAFMDIGSSFLDTNTLLEAAEYELSSGENNVKVYEDILKQLESAGFAEGTGLIDTAKDQLANKDFAGLVETLKSIMTQGPDRDQAMKDLIKSINDLKNIQEDLEKEMRSFIDEYLNGGGNLSDIISGMDNILSRVANIIGDLAVSGDVDGALNTVGQLFTDKILPIINDSMIDSMTDTIISIEKYVEHVSDKLLSGELTSGDTVDMVERLVNIFEVLENPEISDLTDVLGLSDEEVQKILAYKNIMDEINDALYERMNINDKISADQSKLTQQIADYKTSIIEQGGVFDLSEYGGATYKDTLKQYQDILAQINSKKNELTGMMESRYNQLISEGKTHEEAQKIVKDEYSIKISQDGELSSFYDELKNLGLEEQAIKDMLQGLNGGYTDLNATIAQLEKNLEDSMFATKEFTTAWFDGLISGDYETIRSELAEETQAMMDAVLSGFSADEWEDAGSSIGSSMANSIIDAYSSKLLNSAEMREMTGMLNDLMFQNLDFVDSNGTLNFDTLYQLSQQTQKMAIESETARQRIEAAQGMFDYNQDIRYSSLEKDINYKTSSTKESIYNITNNNSFNVGTLIASAGDMELFSNALAPYLINSFKNYNVNV